MDTEYAGWWRRHGLTVALLLSAFGIGLLIRTVFMAPLIEQYGPLNLYGGGSDSFYHARVMTYIIQNHANLIHDSLLNYPNTAVNPREPLFDWMNAVLGILFAPLFGGNAVAAGAWFLDFQGPLWSALGVFPVYLIGKEVSSRRMGIVAAFLYPLMVANIDSSTFGYANYLSFYTFVILVTVFAYLRTIRTTGTRRWVASYTRPREIPAAIRQFVRYERTSVKWAVFTGVALGTLALAWQGYSFAIAVIVIFLLFALIVERIRRVDSFGLYINTWIVGLVGFPMAFPYYLPQGLFAGWFDLPLLIFFGALLIALPFIMLRDTPWVVSIPVLLGVGALGIGLLYFVNRGDFTNIVTGQGYFVKTLVYSTVAEAQAPSIDSLILGYGIVTFFLAFVGLALVIWRMTRQKFPRALMLFLVFGIVSIYLPISAAKFFFLGSAGFALLAAEPIIRFLDIASYPELRRTVGQLSDRRGKLTAFRRSFKARHVLILLLIVVILLPNIWYAIDAGVPYNTKSQYDTQVYDTLPPFLRTAPGNASSFYLGAAGTQLDTPTQYDEAGYNWLAQQDQNLPAPQRPAFISWWDYGFQAVAQGLHPTVADNFQNGIVPAGNFLLAQNESLAIGILATELMTAEQKSSGNQYLPPALNAILARDGVNLATLHTLLVNQSQDVQTVLAHPNEYLPVDASNLDGPNALYDTVSYFLASTLDETGVVQVYQDLQSYTGWSIRYAMVDSRLFPFSGSNTGIFYAPADLTDRIIGAGGAPTTYFTLTVTGSDGKTYAPSALPAGVTAVQYNINYEPAFYHSMIYHIFVGYNGTEIGQGAGIPGVTNTLANYGPEPGWMMQHFQVVYRTAYYCPFSSSVGHPNCFSAVNLPEANLLHQKDNGTADTSSSSYYQAGEAMLEYFPGQPMTGTIALPDGAPVASARVTVYDSWGIPHDTAVTDSAGSYSVLLPPGNDTVNVTTGTLNAQTQAGSTLLTSFKLDVAGSAGFISNAPPLVRPIVLRPATVSGFVYWNTANNTSYIPHTDALVPGASAVLWGGGHAPRRLTTDASGAFLFTNVAPGVYNFSILYRGANFSQPQVYATPGAVVNETRGLAGATIVGFVRESSGLPANGAVVTVTGSDGSVAGTVYANFSGGYAVLNLPAGNYSVRATVPRTSLASPPGAVAIANPGIKVKENLTVAPVFTIEFAVVANGIPVPSFPVRFAPLLPTSPLRTGPPSPNGSKGPPTTGPPAASPATVNSSVFFSDANGFVTAVLPVGNYSVYGLGLSGSTLFAGFMDAYASPHQSLLTLGPLLLTPANRVGGQVAGSSAGPTVPTEIFAYNDAGNVVTAFSNATGGWAMDLPAGRYTLLAVQGLTTANAALDASLTNVTVSGPTTLALALSPAITFAPRIGVPSQTTGLAAATGALVRLTLAPLGASLAARTNGSGNVSFVVPAVVPGGSSYCINVTAAGYKPYATCGLSAAQLQSLTTLPLVLIPVAVNVNVTGLPSGHTVVLNLTATSPTATTTTVTGGPTFHLALAPGTYEITGWAAAPSGGLLLPANPVNVTFPIGAATANVTVPLVRQLGVNGTLLLPTGVTDSVVSVRLLSAGQNLSLTGSAFTTKFVAAPGNYTAYATATGANVSYAALLTVHVPAGGRVTPSLNLTAPAVRLTANLTRPTGELLLANLSLTMVASTGLSVPVAAALGQVRATVPANASYRFVLNTTQLVPTRGGFVYETFTAAPTSTCAVGAPPIAYCVVPLNASAELSAIAGRLVYPGFPSPLTGSVRLVGPIPSTNETTLPVANGSFAAPLAPGTYSLYASAGGPNVALANLTTVTVGPTPGAPVTIVLATTWTVTVTILPPAGGVTGSAALVVKTAGGLSLNFSGEPIGSPIVIPLPEGVYTVTATAPSAPYGIAGNASATASVALVNGNAATQLTLANVLVQTAAVTIHPPVNVSVGTGGVASFAFSVTNTGNSPETIHFVGAPSTWGFVFTPANLTLGTAYSNRTAGGEVIVTVPNGAAVASPTLQIEAVLPDGAVAGTATPAPHILLSPMTGLRFGATPSGLSIGPYVVSATFYVQNTGNIPEGLRLAVADAARLNGLGWSTKILEGKNPVAASGIQLSVGLNSSYQLELTAPTGAALPPGSATVALTLLNGTGGTSFVTIPIPMASVSLNSTSLIVTGPSIGSPPATPDWLIPVLAFLPAIAVLVFLVVRRYLRTRRWSRR